MPNHQVRATIRLVKLEKPPGGWPNKRPLKWAVKGPGEEIQKFTCRKDALCYRALRGRAVDQRAALINFR